MDYSFRFRYLSRFSISATVLIILLSSITFTEAYDATNPKGNITIKWDVLSWTPDGYVAVVTMYNFQHHRRISSPGWTLGWTWAKKEVIWYMFGGQTTEQGDCSKFKGTQPHCCKKTPTVVDLLPGTPYNQQVENCCKGGVINSRDQDPNNYSSSFQVTVGAAGTTNSTVKLPKKFTLLAPGRGYTCGPAVNGRPTKFVTRDGRRVTQAMMTWNVTSRFFITNGIMKANKCKAYDAIDPNGNITIKWDVISWTSDGYVAVVTMYNFQHHRRISPPGWTVGWTWAKKEIIWSMLGGQTTDQGDCSRFKGAIPHCCKKTLTVIDLLPGTPYNQQFANCCKGGVINSWDQDPNNYACSFQLNVGISGTTNKTVKLPKNFTLLAPDPGYTCGPAVVGKPTKFITPDGRRLTQAIMTWNVICAPPERA